MDILGILAFLAQVLRISVPYGLTAVGGAFSERSGIINIALEGILLAGAFGAVAGTLLTGQPVLGVLFGILSGCALAAVHAVVTVYGKADQILSGLALNLLALGGTRALLKTLFESSSNSPRIEGIEPFVQAHGPFGAILGLLTHPLFILGIVLVAVGHRVLFHTAFGLRLRAAGDGPRALDATGRSVALHRVAGVVISGLFGGLGGTWLAMEQHSFTDGMSNGRGYIALAAMIVGKWRPAGAALACLLFGAAEALQIRISADWIPTQFLQMLPYLVTLVVLAGWIGRSHPPRLLGEPYEREGEKA